MDSSRAYLFNGLDAGQIKKVMATGKQISIKKGQQIFKEGQAANGVYIYRLKAAGQITAKKMVLIK